MCGTWGWRSRGGGDKGQRHFESVPRHLCWYRHPGYQSHKPSGSRVSEASQDTMRLQLLPAPSLVLAPPPFSFSRPSFLNALSYSSWGPPHWLPTLPVTGHTFSLISPGLPVEPRYINGKACRTGAHHPVTRTKEGNSIMSPSTSKRQWQFPHKHSTDTVMMYLKHF